MTEDPSLLYHRLTSYSTPNRFHSDDPWIVAGFQPMRPDRRPPQAKAYPGHEVELLDDSHPLSRLLFHTAGVVRVLEVGGRSMWFRAAGSAYWDCGTMLANLLALDGTARLELGFPDAAVAAAVGADGVHEFPLVTVVLGEGSIDWGALPPAATGGFIAHDPLEFPLITATQRASDLDDPSAWRTGGDRDRIPIPIASSVENVILKRGSTRAFDPSDVAPAELLAACREAAAAPVPADVSVDLEHHVLVFGDDETRLLGAHLCLNQALGGSGAFTMFHCADLDATIAQLGSRGYRVAQLFAGTAEGRVHLAAYAMATALLDSPSSTTPCGRRSRPTRGRCW